MPSPADIITLAEVQSYIGAAASGNDAKLGQLITAISQAVRRATDCEILPATFTEVYDGSPYGIMLRHWPVISVSSVTVAPYAGAAATSLPALAVGTPGYVFDAPGDPQASTPQMLTAPLGGFEKGQRITVAYAAGYQISGEAAVVPAGGGKLIVQAPYGAWGSDQGVSYASGGTLRAVPAGAEAKGAYSVSGGSYSFSAADSGAGVLLSYGYVPADIANACIEWIADRLAYQDRIGMASKSLGGQESVSYRITDTPTFVKTMLQPFTNVVPIG